jgi:Kef-type K+ transport system membrane component KefB
VLVALGFLAAYVVQRLQLDVLVAGLTAGCVLINYARPEGERLTRVLQRGAPALYGVVFVIVGAGLQLGALAEVWPWVLVVALVRAFGLHYGLRWAGQDVGVSPTLARNGWMGMVSQAGVTLGLAGVVRRAFPEWGVSLEAFVLGMIGVHETIGPVLFWLGLRRPVDGEVRNAEPVDLDGLAVLPGPSMQ